MHTNHLPSLPLNRRGWIGASLSSTLAALATSAQNSFALEPKASESNPIEVKLRLSSFYNYLPGTLADRLARLASLGFEGVEVRPGKFPGGFDGNPTTNAKGFREVLQDSPLQVSGLDWSHLSAIVCNSATERQKSLDSLKRTLEAAVEIKAPNIVAVPPRIGRGFELPSPQETRKILLDTLPELGRMAADGGTCILIEPCTRDQVNSLHLVADVASLVREMKSPGLGIVADFCLMWEEETNITGALLSGGRDVRQIHLSGRGRRMPGFGKEDEGRYLEGFRGLKMIGYKGFCSYECGMPDTFEKQLPQSMEFLRKTWAKA